MWSGFYSYTSLLKQCSHALLPTITNIINQSISTGFLPDQFKSCSIFSSSPQKANLDKGDLINYRPIYHLALLSKLTERVVKLSLTEYLSNNKLIFNSFQTAYFFIKHHSSEWVIKKSPASLSLICLLLLIPFITLFSLSVSAWFGINSYSTALSCIKSYLLNRSFRPYVTIEHLVSFVCPQIYGIPQGFVLGPLLFILYTTPLSTVQWRSQDLMKGGPIQGVLGTEVPQRGLGQSSFNSC